MVSLSVRVPPADGSWFLVAFCALARADVPKPSLVADTFYVFRAVRRLWTRLLVRWFVLIHYELKKYEHKRFLVPDIEVQGLIWLLMPLIVTFIGSLLASRGRVNKNKAVKMAPSSS
jgi:hypothetical protein